MNIIIIIYNCSPIRHHLHALVRAVLIRLKVGIFTVKVSIQRFMPPLQLIYFYFECIGFGS